VRVDCKELSLNAVQEHNRGSSLQSYRKPNTLSTPNEVSLTLNQAVHIVTTER